MDTIEPKKFKFNVVNSPEDSYTKIGISEEFGFGFMQRDSGYIAPLFGPEIYDVKKKYNLNEEEMIELYMFGSVTYYPENIDKFHGAFDILYDNTVYTYEKSAETEDGEGITLLKMKGMKTNNDPIVFETDELSQKMESGDALALWPLIKKAHR